MRRINFNPEYVAPILKGRKCTTVRKGKRRYTRGEVVELTVNHKPFARAKVLGSEVKRIAELTDEDARLDGFTSRQELLRVLRKIYGRLKENEFVTIVHFEVMVVI